MGGWLARWGRGALIVPPLALGALALFVAVQWRDTPAQVDPGETAVTVRVVPAPELDVVPRASGHGSVQPGRVWEAVAQVGGRVVDIHPDLKRGAIVAAGAVLIQIDPADYELAVRQAEAAIGSAEAEIQELEAKVRNTRASLAIEDRNLELAQGELDRQRQLLSRGTVSQAAADAEERNVLAREQAVQELRNQLDLFPAQRALLQARLAQEQARLAEARLDLERTTITVPFDARVAEVNVERDQFAGAGSLLAVADSMDVAEVTAQVPVGRMINLLPPDAVIPDSAATAMSLLPHVVGLKATVRLAAGGVDAAWEARFSRMNDTLDPETRTIGVIVAVDDPYGQIEPGVRPPLAKNMFVTVELRGRPRPGTIVVPRAAIHAGSVYIAGDDDRLAIRPVTVAFTQEDIAVIRDGLAAGDRVIVSDLLPAVEGMLLSPVTDDGLTAHVAAQATGGSGAP